MLFQFKAVIFDMDGVLIDSEPLWRRAMIKGFNEIGLNFTDDDCRKTTGMRFKEVVEIWLEHYGIKHVTPVKVEERVTDLLTGLILREGKAIPGVLDILDFAKNMNLKTGLATSSSHRLMKATVEKLQIESNFNALVSAEKMKYGKPHPEVFMSCMDELEVKPHECIIVEDSINGVIAAKAAQARVFAVPDHEHKHLKGFDIADWKCEDMHEVLRHFKELSRVAQGQ